MTCQRCAGLMVSEWFYDLQGTSGDFCVEGYRCLVCGNLVDATILQHKRRDNRRGVTEAVDPLSAVMAGGGRHCSNILR
ncbi:MAG: hypothetical protein KF751_02695 [Nitrospira sp.]|nr:hypothetical protein [Nitrospira sp.]